MPFTKWTLTISLASYRLWSEAESNSEKVHEFPPSEVEARAREFVPPPASGTASTLQPLEASTKKAASSLPSWRAGVMSFQRPPELSVQSNRDSVRAQPSPSEIRRIALNLSYFKGSAVAPEPCGSLLLVV